MNRWANQFSSEVSHDPDYRKHLFAFVCMFAMGENKGLQACFWKNPPQDGMESGVLFMNFHLFLWQVLGSPVRHSHLLFSWLQWARIRHRSPRLPNWQRRDQKLLTRTIGGIAQCSLEQYFRQIITRLIPNLLAGPLSCVIFLSMLLIWWLSLTSRWLQRGGERLRTRFRNRRQIWGTCSCMSLSCGTLAEIQINK